ncbi:MAG: GNAT family N-acetyltransferase [Alphaproteobacteria bacterium]|nr:GNAT family N-acetyltransferase [Alphaproteobacteria bacterium]
MSIHYSRERPAHQEIFDLLVQSGLFANVTATLTPSIVGHAFDGSNLVTSARSQDGRLLGLCRALTDFSRHCFVATLAVHPSAKQQGIGKALLHFTHSQAGDPSKIVVFLHSSPDAVGFYEHIGLVREANCFSINNVS